MAFNINAQVILSGPKNLGKISKQIQTSLGKSGAIKVKIDPSSLRNIKILNSTIGTLNTNIASLNSSASKLQSTLNGVNRNLSKASSATSSFSKSQSNTASSIKNVNNALQQQNQQLGNLGKRFLSTAKTAVAFGLISRPIYDLQRAFIGATKDAVAFEREIVRISQVTGQTVKQLGNLRNDINRLSTSLGISANELAETARIIAQTGQSAENTRVILEALSRSTLAPTFGSITDTTEGLVAALGQFNLGAKDSEAILGALNRVSKNFAVESEDLISVIRRTGGVFAQAAGDSRNTIGALEELIAIFTAVRSTTRESADTIAAGLRTIFSRIQRRGTIEFLEQFGVQLTNAKGQFIGVFPAFDELSRKLDSLIKQGDALTLSAIAEELGGIRQIGKLLPAIAQFDKARSALEQAQKGAIEGLGTDVDKALNTIDNRIARVRESFAELIRTVFESPAFQQFAKTVLTLSETFLNLGTTIAKVIEPVLPLLATLGAVKLGNIAAGFIGGGGLGKVAGAASAVTGQATATNTAQVAAAAKQSVSIEQQMLSVLNQTSTQLSNIFSLQSADNKLRNNQLSNIFQAINRQAARSAAPTVVGGFGGPRRRASGGQIYGFNRGGMVPGTGNRDTVPAMLTPGEFVIKKSSVESIGAGTLASMNKFNDGGAVARLKPDVVGGLFLQEKLSSRNTDFEVDAPQGKKIGRNNIGKIVGKINTATLQPEASAIVGEETRSSIKDAIANSTLKSIDALSLPAPLNFNPQNAIDSVLKRIDFNTLEGYVFEGFIGALSNLTLSESEAGFDFPSLSQRGVSRLLEAFQPDNNIRNVKLLEAKRTLSRGSVQNASNSIANKILTAAGSPLLPSSDFTITRVGSGPLSPDEEQELSELEAQRKKKGFLGQKSGKRFDALRARRGFNSGGGISGEDTVPALLTPGEFVFSKKSASRIGYGNLNRMNKDGVQGFNKGGPVGIQRFANGSPGGVKPTGGAGIDIGALSGALFSLQFAFQDVANLFSGEGTTLGGVLQTLITVGTSLAFTLQAINAQQLAQGFGNLLDGVKKLPTNIKNLPANLKGINKSITDFGKNLKGTKSFTGAGKQITSKASGRLGKFKTTKTDRLLGKGAEKLGSFLNKLPKGQLINKAGASVIGRVLATGLTGPVAAAVAGGLTAASIGGAVGNAIERFTAGPVEEVAGFRGREGGRQDSVALTGALSGAAGGAAAGAAIGSVIPGIGTALGAAIGAASGLIGGSIVAAINGPLEDAAFAAAKELQKNGEDFASTLSDLDKDFSVSNFDQFTSGLIQFQANTEEASQTFKKKFTEEISFSNLFRTQRGDFRKALQSLGQVLDPKQVAKARDNLNKGLATVSRAIDLDVTGVEDYNDFLSNLTDAANKGNALAKNYLQALSEQYDLEIQSRAAELTKLDEGRGEGGFKGRDLGPALLQLQESAREAGEDLSSMSKEELQQFARANLNGSRAFKDSVANIVSAQNDEIKKRQEEAAALAKTNALLRESEKALNLFVSGLNKIEDELAVSIAKSSLAINNLETTTNALANSQILFTDGLSGFEFGEAGGDLRQQRISAIGAASGQDVSSIQKFDTVVTNADEIGKGALSVLNEQAQDGQVSTQDVQSAFVSEIEGSLGSSLAGPLKEGVEKSFEAFSRQLGDGSKVSIDALKDAVEQGKVKELFGPTFEKFSQTTEKLSDAFDALNANTVEQAKVQLSLLKAQRNAAAETLKRRRAIEDFQLDPEKVFSGDGIAKAETRLAEDLRALGFSATDSAQDIANAQTIARDNQIKYNKELQAGTITQEEYRDRASKAADANDRASAALSLLANDTRKLSAIQAQAAKLIENRSASRTQATEEFVARETGDISSIARRREQSRIVQAGIRSGASQDDRRRLLLAASQDPSLQREIALQRRAEAADTGDTSLEGKTTQQIFDDTLLQELRSQAASEQDPLERARLEQQIVDIEAEGLGGLQEQALSLQEKQLIAQDTIAQQEQVLLQNQVDELINVGKIAQEGFNRLTKELANLGTTQGQQSQVQQQQVKSQEKQTKEVEKSGRVNSRVANRVAAPIPTSSPQRQRTNSRLRSRTTRSASNENVARLVSDQQYQNITSSNQASDNQQEAANKVVEALEKAVPEMRQAAELQNEASKRMEEGANAMPQTFSHVVAPVEMNGFADLPRALNDFINTFGQIAQRMIDSKNQYSSDQGDGVLS